MDDLTATITDDLRGRSLSRRGIGSVDAMEPAGSRRHRGNAATRDPKGSRRWNLEDELARRRSQPRRARKAIPSMHPVARPVPPIALAPLTDGWLLPPAWPLEEWHGALAACLRALVEVRLLRPLRRLASRRRRDAQGRGLMVGAAISAIAAFALAGWHAGAAPASPRSPSASAGPHAASPSVAVPAPPSVVPVQASAAAPAVALPSMPARTAAAQRPFADVSTMDLMMPIAEPDLDIASRQSLWAQVGRSTGVDPLLLYSIALVESKALDPSGNLAPTPWLFRVNDHVVRGDRHDVQLAMAAASQFGSAVQDVGIMQVYYPMHRDAVRDPLLLLNPRTNITVAARILREGMHETRDRVLGVGYYHSHTPALARDYGTQVLSVYQRLKAIYRAPADKEIAAG